MTLAGWPLKLSAAEYALWGGSAASLAYIFTGPRVGYRMPKPGNG